LMCVGAGTWNADTRARFAGARPCLGLGYCKVGWGEYFSKRHIACSLVLNEQGNGASIDVNGAADVRVELTL
jgi:hypothetical protein